MVAQILISELVDEIFEYLDAHDLHTCLFVSRQFNAHAIPFIYRTIALEGGSNPLNSPAEKSKLLKAQENIWETIRCHPSYAGHIQFMEINPCWTEGCPEKIPPFAERVDFIVRHTQHLRKVDFISPKVLTDGVLETFISALKGLERKPEIFLSVYRSVIGGESEETAVIEALLKMKDIAPVTKLEIWLDKRQNGFDFAAKFHQLQKIVIFPTEELDDIASDLDQLLGGLSLIKMTIWPSLWEINSFPHRLESLSFYGDCETIPESVWTAICNLRNLQHLKFAHFEIDYFEYPIPFQSSNLRTLFANVIAESEFNIMRQIILPIYQNCRLLTSVELILWTCLSSDFLLCLLQNPTLSSLILTSYGASPYTFQDLVWGVKNAPNLKTLRLPWPATLGIHSNNADRPTNWTSSRDRSLDVPERLTFEESQQLAASLPKIQEIRFDIDGAEEACNAYWTWNEFPYWPIGTPESMPLDLRNVDVEFWRKSQYALLQSFKIARFLDEPSTCLNICTMFFHFNDPNYPDTKFAGLMNITLFLSLKQIRRHDGTLYCIQEDKTNYRCGDECKLLLKDDEAVRHWNNTLEKLIKKCKDSQAMKRNIE